MSESSSHPTPWFPPASSRNSSSDYSDVGDFAADTEFYVPGVNDPDTSITLTDLPSISTRSEFNYGSRRFSLVTSARILNPNPSSVPRHPFPKSRSPQASVISDADPKTRSHVPFIPEDDSVSPKSPAAPSSDFVIAPMGRYSPEFTRGRQVSPEPRSTTKSPSPRYRQARSSDGTRDRRSPHADNLSNRYDDIYGNFEGPPDGSDSYLGKAASTFDGYDKVDGNFDDDGDGEIVGATVVRQNSNFSRLSAQSWLTVDSAQDVHVAEDDDDVPEIDDVTFQTPLTHKESRTIQSPRSTAAQDAPMLFNQKYSEVEDHDPGTLFNVDPRGDVMNAIQHKAVPDLSVFECCALLQAGVAAYKKKSFRRYGVRRVWLSPECDHLYWTSKKTGVFTDHVKLQKVAKMKCTEREVCIDITEGYRISLIFANADEAGMWVRALSCLIPLQARVRETRGIIPAEKEREDYNLSDDVFNNIPLREYMSVNSYVVLCCAKGQPLSMGNKLAFSRSDGLFCGLRYVPHKIVPLILRSQEEIAVLKRLSHPNVVKYHECLLDTEHGGNYVVFEHLARGSLMDASKLEGVRPIQEKAARELIRDVVNALEYLHTLRIAHGDVRPDNLLRSVNGSVKLNPIGCITHDFTEIKNVPALVKARLGDASPAFLAPELCWQSNAPEAHAKSYAMDVWAVGAVLYFMLYGRVPFGGRDDQEIQDNICKGKLRFPRQPETSKNVRSLLKALLSEKDPKTRIALAELKTHPWFLESEQTALHGTSGHTPESTRLIVSPAEVDSAIQVAKVRVATKRGS